MTLPCFAWFCWASALTQPPVQAFSSCRSMECPWDGQSCAAECGQPLLPLIPAIIMGSKGPSQSPVFQLGIPLLYWAACIWSLSPTEKLPPLSQEPPQHPILSAHKCAQKPVLHVVAIYYRRGPQEGQHRLQKGWDWFHRFRCGGKLACTVERWWLGEFIRNNGRTNGIQRDLHVLECVYQPFLSYVHPRPHQ